MEETPNSDKLSNPMDKCGAEKKTLPSTYFSELKRMGRMNFSISGYVLAFVIGAAVVFLGTIKNKEHKDALFSDRKSYETALNFDGHLSDSEKKLNLLTKDFQNLRQQHSSRLDELTSQVSALIENQKNQPFLLKTLPNVTTLDQDFSNLEKRLKSLEDQLSQSSSSTISNTSSALLSDLHVLNDKFQKLESTLVSHLSLLDENSSSRDVLENNLLNREQLDRVSKVIDALTASREEIDKSLSVQGQGLEKLANDLKEAQTILNQQKMTILEFSDVVHKIEPLSSQIVEFGQQLEGYKGKLSIHETYLENLQIFFAFFDLKKSIEKGRPYAGELQALSKTSNGKLDLKLLETYQNEGVPTLEEIKNSSLSIFPLKSNIHERSPHGSLWETLVTKASSFVQIRRIGISSTEDESLLIENIDKGVAESRFEEALEAAEKLPPDLKATISDWYKKLFTRVSVDRSLTNIEKELKEKIISQGFSTSLSSGP